MPRLDLVRTINNLRCLLQAIFSTVWQACRRRRREKWLPELTRGRRRWRPAGYRLFIGREREIYAARRRRRSTDNADGDVV